METNRIEIDNQGEGMEDVLNEVEKFAVYQEYTHKETLHLRLLAEEMLGMIRGIVGEFQAVFWAENQTVLGGENTGKACALHVEAATVMDIEKREGLLSLSSSGKNMAAKGLMGKIRNIFESYRLQNDEVNKLQMEYYMNVMPYYGSSDLENSQLDMSQAWLLSDYKGTVYEHKEENQEAWDELEKSIVAKLADDVLVGIRDQKVEVIIYKSFDTV